MASVLNLQKLWLSAHHCSAQRKLNFRDLSKSCSIFGPCISTFGQFADVTFLYRLTLEMGSARLVPSSGADFGRRAVPPFDASDFRYGRTPLGRPEVPRQGSYDGGL
jgi:hypothetical protein